MVEIAGGLNGLRQGFRELGRPCDLINRIPHPYKYPDDHWASRALQWLCYESAPPGRRKRPLRKFWALARELFKFGVFLMALVKYDVFIFYYHTTFSDRWRDLPILKFFKKKLIFVYVGSDSRPPYLGGAVPVDLADPAAVARMTREAAAQKRQIQRIEKYADYIVNWLPQAYFHERPIVLGNIIGLPATAPAEQPARPAPEAAGRPPVVLHAPSKSLAKGSPLIRAAVERLKQRGLDFQYVEVSGQPHAKVMELLGQCDFVVDQVFSDTPMAGFATEAAFFGKPALVGGYFAEVINDYVPPEAVAPSLYVHPDQLEETMARLIVDADYRLKAGQRAREYARTYLAPAKVAARFLRLIEDDVPAQWFRNPADIKYLAGDSLPLEQVRARVAAVIRTAGAGALRLSDKPELERAFVDFAGEG